MSETVTLTIDGQEVTVSKGTTILDAAAQLGINIPVICYSPALTANGLCRICSVDAGWRVQLAACVTECQDNMNIKTGSENVNAGRKTLLELLASTVNLEEAPEIAALIDQYGANPERFSGRERRTAPVYEDNPFYIRDYNQCINCWRCVQVCAEDAQYTFALNFDGRGFHTQIGTFQGDGMMDTTCVFCGHCVAVCPTGALKPQRQALLEQGLDPDSVFERTRGGLRKQRRRSQ